MKKLSFFHTPFFAFFMDFKEKAEKEEAVFRYFC